MSYTRSAGSFAEGSRPISRSGTRMSGRPSGLEYTLRDPVIAPVVTVPGTGPGVGSFCWKVTAVSCVEEGLEGLLASATPVPPPV